MYQALSNIGETRLTSADIFLDSLGSKALRAVISPPKAHASSRFLRRVSTALAILVAAAVPCAHAQTRSSAVETGNIETLLVTGAAADHADANASMKATSTIATGTARTDDKAVSVGQPGSDPSHELPPFHPLTDF